MIEHGNATSQECRSNKQERCRVCLSSLISSSELCPVQLAVAVVILSPGLVAVPLKRGEWLVRVLGSLGQAPSCLVEGLLYNQSGRNSNTLSNQAETTT